MTLDEFIDALSQTPRAWFLSRHGEIRLRGSAGPGGFGARCPANIVAGGTLSGDAARVLGLPGSAAMAIMAAADNAHDHDPALRARLLAACGLTEPKATP